MSAPKKRPSSKHPKGKRGRPALKIQKTKDNFDQSQSIRSVLENYETTKVTYECSLFTQQLCLMLQRIAASPCLRLFTKEPVYQSLVKAVKEVMLTELEVALWSIVLATAETDFHEVDLLLYFRISAFAVRKVTEGEIMLNDVEAFLETKPGFQRNFSKWFDKNKRHLECPLQIINQAFETLTKPIGPQDFNMDIYALIIDEVIDEPFAAEETVEEEKIRVKREEGTSGSQQTMAPLVQSLVLGGNLGQVLGLARRMGEPPGQLPSLSNIPSYEPLDGFEPFKDFSTGPKP